MKTKRQRELAARRESLDTAKRDYEAGFRAGINGDPLPEDASLAFATGHSDARELKGEPE